MSLTSFLYGPEHTVERVQPTLDRQRYRREVVDHRMNKLSDAEKTWLKKYYDERKRELVEYSLCSPCTRFCHGTISNHVTLREHQTIRILVVGPAAHGTSSSLKTFFALLGSKRDNRLYYAGVSDSWVEDYSLQVEGQYRSIVLTETRSFFGKEETDGPLMDAFILGKLRAGDSSEDAHNLPPHPADLSAQCLALIFVVSCERYENGFWVRCFQEVRRVIKRRDIVPITIVTHVWDRETGRIRADYQQVLRDAAEVVGSAPCHIFPFENEYPLGLEGTPQFQERLEWNRLNGLMALQEALVQAELRLNRKNLMEDEELAWKKIVTKFMDAMAEKYAWNEARYSQVMANLKKEWLNLPDNGFRCNLSPRDFIAICDNAQQDPTCFPFLSRVMAIQVLEGMEAMREKWQ